MTASGRILHEKVHSGINAEKRNDLIIFRTVKVSSERLGISGECDVVEFHRSDNGVPLKNYKGLWLPYIIEYKRGKTKPNDCDRLQLCAQAACLEEMLCCEIKSGALFYGEPRRREVVEFTDELREKLSQTTEEMHKMFSRKYTPKPKRSKFCSNCSLKDYCLPKLGEKSEDSVQKYIEDNLR